jgi:integrase
LSYPKHILCRNGHFYYKVKVPVDLLHHFPSPVIKKSLKTTDPSTAKAIMANLEHKVQRVFTLLRTGMLDEAMVKDLVNEVSPAKEPRSAASARGPSKSRGPFLSKIIRQYTTEKETGWTPKTKMEMEGVFKLLADIQGDIDVTTITKQTMLDLRAKLMRLPANLYKKYPGQSSCQLLERPDIVPMSMKSVNKHVGAMGALLRYCAGEGIVRSNYAAGLKVSAKKRADEERDAYTPEDIKRIVDNLPRQKQNPEKYWIPLIGCYTGMRLNEICQLYLEDVQEVDSVWCISINDQHDKRLKNASSRRVIPIHPKLMELGFLDHVNKVRTAGHPWLWMNLTWMDIHGYSNGFGKWYQRFNRVHVTRDPKRVFHSFRHLVTDMMKQAGVQDTLIAEIVGHSHGSHTMTMGRYGKRYQPKVLLEALKRLDYGIDIPEWKV